MSDNQIAREVREILEQMSDYYDETQIKPGEVTWRQFADYKHIDGDCAKNFLENLVKEKKLTRRMVTVDGKRCTAYAKP